MMKALEAGAEDVQVSEDGYEIYTAPTDFSAVRDALENDGFTFLSAERQKIPQTTNEVTDGEQLEKIQKLLDMLDDNEDVMDVFHNADLPEEEEKE